VKDMLCYCGHDCGRCLTYLATVRDNTALRKQSQKFYRDEMDLSLPLSAFRCLGGHAKDEDVFAPCRDCPFRNCCRERELSSCEECDRFPCQMLEEYRKRYVNRCNQTDLGASDQEKSNKS